MYHYFTGNKLKSSRMLTANIYIHNIILGICILCINCRANRWKEISNQSPLHRQDLEGRWMNIAIS